MISSPSITITADLAARVNYIMRDYDHIIGNHQYDQVSIWYGQTACVCRYIKMNFLHDQR